MDCNWELTWWGRIVGTGMVILSTLAILSCTIGVAPLLAVALYLVVK